MKDLTVFTYSERESTPTLFLYNILAWSPFVFKKYSSKSTGFGLAIHGISS